MGLTIYQKSVYLIILNSTMILRSIGKSFQKDKNRLQKFKVEAFNKIMVLTDKMDRGELTEKDIEEAIDNLSEEFGISIGQSQKPINVILKYHFYLTRNNNKNIEETLHCPVDSTVLGQLKEGRTSLSRIDKGKYLEIQYKIKQKCNPRIKFDDSWDEQNLRKAGIPIV